MFCYHRPSLLLLLPLLRDIDVVLSATSWGASGDLEVRFINLCKQAGVKWFIPSGFGYALDAQNSWILPLFNLKIQAVEAVKASGMDWTIVSNGAFAEWLIGTPNFGVDVDKRMLTIPVSGKTTITSTSLVDVGLLLADAVVTGRGRNEELFFAGSTLNYDALAVIMERVSGATWTKVVRSEEELKTAFTKNPQDMASRFAYLAGTAPKQVSWPLDKTYNGMHGIATTSVEQIAHTMLAPKSS